MAGSRVPLLRSANIISDVRMQGWALSLLLHLSVVSIVVLFLAEIKPPLEKQPFRWEVSFVEPPAPQPTAAPSAQIKRPPDVMAHRPKSASIVRTVQPEMKSLVAVQHALHQPVEQRRIEQRRIETKQPAEVSANPEITEVTPRPVEKQVHEVPPHKTQASVNHETTQERKIIETEPIETAQAMQQAMPVEAKEPVSSVAVVAERNVSAHKELQTIPASQGAEASPVVKNVLEAPRVEKQASAQSVRDTHERPVQQAVSTEAQAIPLQPLVALTEPTQHTLPTASTHEQDVIQSAREQPDAVTTPARSVPAPRPDYGWLMHALRRRIEQLKRYPSKARLNRWEGIVVVQAVIRADGQVADLIMEQSSGHDELDQDALELVRRASPIPLKHELGKPEITIRIPIRYKLE